jgi:hypothetical protein
MTYEPPTLSLLKIAPVTIRYRGLIFTLDNIAKWCDTAGSIAPFCDALDDIAQFFDRIPHDISRRQKRLRRLSEDHQPDTSARSLYRAIPWARLYSPAQEYSEPAASQ